MHKIIFFGTGAFAVPSLKALVQDGRFDVVAVVTQPDRPTGRHAALTAPPVKLAAQDLGLREIKQPEKLKDETFASWMREAGPKCDVFVVVSYGKILPQWLLDVPPRGVVNLHGSLLPRWRGPSPIQTAIATGDAKTGVTVMLVDAKMDHGPILSATETSIQSGDTGAPLHDRLALLGADLLPQTLADFLENRLKPREQDHAQATYCKILTREDGKIDWRLGANEIERRIRAYHPWPGAWTVLNGKRLKVLSAGILTGDDTFKPGQCFVFERRPAVAAGDGTALELVTVQMEGRERLEGGEFLMGQKDWENLSL